VRAQDGQVRVRGLPLLVRVAVHHGEAPVVVLLAHEAAGILAERAHLVLEGLGVADQLGFVKDAVDGLHDLVSDLDPDADIDGSGLVSDVVLRADALKPVGSAASRRNNGALCVNFYILTVLTSVDAAADVVLKYEVGAFTAEKQLDAVFGKVFFD